MRIVVDASVALSWVLGDEDPTYADLALEAVLERGAAVPAIWPSEIANALLVAVRRKRLTSEGVTGALARLERLDLEVESGRERSRPRRLYDLGAASGLTAYDASYLDLCTREGLVLATQDVAMIRAAAGAGVEVLGRKGSGRR